MNNSAQSMPYNFTEQEPLAEILMSLRPKVLDLFCGAGGMSLGFKTAGCEIVGGVDIEPWPVATHHHNFPNARIQLPPQDIRDVEPSSLGYRPGDIDIVVGGPPCQGFSQVGRGKIRSLGQERERDVKNKLYREFIRFVAYFQPKVFVIENVIGMTTFKHSNFLQNVLTDLEHGLPTAPYPNNIGYTVHYKVLCAKDYGVPQVRNRLFIVGVRKDLLNFEFRFPEPLSSPAVTLKQAISDLPRLVAPVLKTRSSTDLGSGGISQKDRAKNYRVDPQSDYQRRMRLIDGLGVRNHLCRGHNAKDLEIFALLRQGQIYRDLPAKHRRYRDDIFDDKYRRLRYDFPSWTLTAHMQKDCLAYIHPTQTRSLSAREAARIQSFPDYFIFQGPLTRVFRMIGNAVPPLLAEEVGKPIVQELIKLKQSELSRSAVMVGNSDMRSEESERLHQLSIL